MNSELGWTGKPGESDDLRLLRQRLVPFVATVGEQKELIEEADKLARKWLVDRSAISPDMAGQVLRTAARFGNRDLFDRMHETAVKEKDRQRRQRLIVALGAFRDPKIAQAGLQLLLSKEFDPREGFFALLFGGLGNPETRELPFQFLKQNIDRLLELLPREVGEDYAANFPFAGAAFCDASHRADVEAFFQDRVKNYSGGPRNLAQVLEGIDLCIAERKALGPELAAFLNAR